MWAMEPREVAAGSDGTTTTTISAPTPSAGEQVSPILNEKSNLPQDCCCFLLSRSFNPGELFLVLLTLFRLRSRPRLALPNRREPPSEEDTDEMERSEAVRSLQLPERGPTGGSSDAADATDT